jgi:N-ethylmaleimide reductase
MSQLLKPFSYEKFATQNRIVMSAMTRGFSTDKCCNPLMTDYYARRAAHGVGLILTEGIVIHSSGNGYNDVPFIETKAQAESWIPCLNKVHQAGSKMFAQLWHCGRISHSDYTGGLAPVSSSSIRAEGINRQNNKEYGIPRELRADELPEIVAQYVTATRNALDVGFDGVELHFGHGYLIDQFFDTRINQRTDQYGGSIENRSRFAVEIVKAVLAIAAPNQLMIRISPSREMNGLYEWSDMLELLKCFLSQIDSLGVRLIDISCANANYFNTSGKVIRIAREYWKHVIIGGASLSIEDAEREISDGNLDLVTWGRLMIANPDFAAKVANNTPLIAFDNAMRNSLN